MQITLNNLAQIPLQTLDPQNSLTDFSLGPVPDSLTTSIQAIGVIHPVVLTKSGDRLIIICGHRRVNACQSLQIAEIPALFASSDLDEETMLMLNLTENQGHRTFSDIEKGRILNKLAGASVSEDIIIGKYMPLMGLERSKKLYQDLSAIERFSPALQKLWHELNAPLRVFSALITWDAPSRDAAENLFFSLRPGINKCRDLLELVEEIARIENTSHGELLRREEIQTLLAATELSPHEKYDRIVQTLTPWRYPTLSALRKKIAQTLDQLTLGSQTKIRIQESFETEDIKIEIRGRSQKSLIEDVEKLERAARSEAMGELLRILRELN
ncbi:MAG: ParB/RepB/Spo0J family partition protein [Nitrospinae bacterium]|jgi:ParB family transcriptional regulator, chromosome partitioning protein|nr:ParB/RepB/Spo0J family partition protein [Nitrospinota bacterium]MDA1110395.1 ParB/RepB/Spo0J family partition protein [Nitrospinota bacterium]